MNFDSVTIFLYMKLPDCKLNLLKTKCDHYKL